MSFIYPENPWGGIRRVRVDSSLTLDDVEMIKSQPEWYLDLRSSSVPAIKSLDNIFDRFSAVFIMIDKEIPHALWENISHVKYLNLSFGTKMGSLDFSRFKSLKKIVLDACEISTDKLFTSSSYSSLSVIESAVLKGLDLSKMRNIVSISVNRVKSNDLPVDWGWEHLRQFHLLNYRGSDFQMPDDLKQILELRITNSKVQWQRDFPFAPNLVNLTLENCGSVPSMHNLRLCENLNSLSIELKNSVKGLESLSYCKKLQTVDVRGGGFANFDLSWLTSMKSLDALGYFDRKQYIPSQPEVYSSLGLGSHGFKGPSLRGIALDPNTRLWDD